MTWYLNGMVAARRAVFASLLVLGSPTCGGKREDVGRADRAPAPPLPQEQPAAPEPEPAAPPEFPRETRSLEIVRTIGVRLDPGDDAKRIGTIAIDTRVAWTRTAPGKGCQRSWVEMKPRGWICADYVRPSTKPPLGREVPILDRGEVVPGIYGKVISSDAITYTLPKPDKKKKKKEKGGDRKGPITSPSQVDGDSPEGPKLVEGKPLVGSVTVRQYEEATFDGHTYWKIAPKEAEYVLREDIMQHTPSMYAGARLGDDTGLALPIGADEPERGGRTIGFVWSRWGGAARPMYDARGATGLHPTAIPARTLVPILETATDAAGAPTAYRIADQRWLPAPDVRVFAAAPPPALLLPGERWIDVDLDSQILVAFEGDLAVYATMVSSGLKETPTETGEYRMWLKESEADMNGLTGEDPYSVATVPWTQFFNPEKGLALHTAYWHDQFGVRRSHGCVNLAPRDARWLYYWSDPQVPPGWTMASGVVEAPGSIVRVRSKDDPTPAPKGYAKKVVEARQQNAPVREPAP